MSMRCAYHHSSISSYQEPNRYYLFKPSAIHPWRDSALWRYGNNLLCQYDVNGLRETYWDVECM